MKNFITKSLFLLVVTMLIASVTGFAAFAVGGAVGAASLFPKPKGVAMMALDVEIWKPWILDTLFKDNQFLNFARNADEHVLQGTVVHIPNSGAASSVSRNRQSLPASVTQRTDIDVTYSLDEFTTDPRLIIDADKILSYDKMSSTMGQDMGAIAQLVADWMIYHWAPSAAAQIIRTTGTSVTAHLPSATGNRKKFLPADLKTARKVLNKQNVSKVNRYAMFPSDLYEQMTDALTETQYREFSKAMDPATGVVGELYGFKILERSDTCIYTNASTPVKKLPTAAAAATDNDCVVCWQKDHVERAIGTTTIFEDLRNPTYYGDIYSLLLRAGGRAVENNSRGIVAIVQDASN